MQVLCIADAAETLELVREALATGLPSAALTATERNASVASRLPDADCAVIDVEVEGRPGVETARDLRAAGFRGAIVLLVEQRDDQLAQRAAPIGALHLVPLGDIARALAPAVATSTAGAESEESPVWRELRRTQRLIAAGEVALGLQHALNNPLTALLAEAQLLEMEPMGEEQLAAVRRMIEQCRRLIGLVRRLDVVGGGKTGR